jgi:hypothetical protein
MNVDFVSPWDGSLLWRLERPVAYGILPTLAWEPGQTIKDHLYLRVPDELIPLEYELRLGFFDPDSDELLSINEGDALGRIPLQGPDEAKDPDKEAE